MADDEANKATPARKPPAKKTAAKKAAPKKAGGRQAKEPAMFGQPLTARERRSVMLSALGYTDGKIAKELGPPFGIVSNTTTTNDILSAGIKLGLGRHGLVIWAIQQLKGEMLEKQRRFAERRRAQLRASGVMTPTRVRIAMLYADPQHCDSTQAEIGEMCEPKIPATKVSSHVRAMTVNIGPNGSLNKLIAIMTLAPFSDRTTGDAVEEPETL